MAIKFIKSIDIEVFPAVHRATAYAISKRTTEDNLTKFGKLSSNKDNLSQMFKDPDDSSYVIFNIAGYWFRCLETKIPSGVDINAYIKLTYDDNIGYMLSPIGIVGTLLDDGTENNEDFKGLAFTEDDVPNNSDGVVYYGLKIKNGSVLTFQNLKLDASEIRNNDSDDPSKAISQEFDTGTLTAETINGLTIEATTGTLAIADGKTIAVNKSITLAGTDGKTVNAYANLDVGASSTNTGKVTIQSAGSSATTIIGPNDGTTTLLNGEMVEKDAAQKLTQKTFVAPILGAATATSINKVTITPPGTSSVLTIADGKTVAAIANLTVGAAPSNTGGVTIKSSTNNDSTITAPGNGSVTLFAGDMVEKDKIQTLTRKTLTSPILTTPKINDLSSNHRYNIAVSELAADRIITLPLLLGDDEFVFKNFTQTLKNKTLTSPTINTSDINGGTVDSLTSLSIRDTSAAFDVTIAGTSSTALTAGRKLTLDIVNADKTIKLTGSPSLSGITTTGTGTLALNTNLTVNGANKTFAGDGNSLTIDNNLDIAGTTGQITLGTGAHTLAFTTTSNTEVTLPTAGTLATVAGSESLTGKTYNGLSLTATASGFSIENGAASNALTVNATYTLRDACAKEVKDASGPTAVSGSGTNLMTEKAVYYGLPTINKKHDYNSTTGIYVPTTSGNDGQLLVANYQDAPTWANSSSLVKSLDTTSSTSLPTNASESIGGNGTIKLNEIAKTGETKSLIATHILTNDTSSYTWKENSDYHKFIVVEETIEQGDITIFGYNGYTGGTEYAYQTSADTSILYWQIEYVRLDQSSMYFKITNASGVVVSQGVKVYQGEDLSQVIIVSTAGQHSFTLLEI